MSDLIVSLSAMGALCLAALVGGASLQTRARRGIVNLSLVAVCALMAVYFGWIWDRPIVSRLFPFSSAIILGNWLPVIGSFLAGICLRTTRVHVVRRRALSAATSMLCGYSLLFPLLGSRPLCMPTEPLGALEYQTTDQTCSAACAASLLRMHGIDATERELAELCLTRKGTHWLGVYRGLKLKTAGTEWTVVAEEIPSEYLRRGPMPLGVLSLTFGIGALERSAESGFGTDVGHSVVSLGQSFGESLVVFDPAPDYGIETWNEEMRRDIKGGILLRLVSKRGTPSPQADIEAYRRPYWLNTPIAQR